MPKCMSPIRNVSGKGVGEWDGVAELEQFDKKFVKTTEKEILQRHILNGKFNPKMSRIRAFLSKIRTLFSIFKKNKGGLLYLI